MFVTKEQFAKQLSDNSGFRTQDIKVVLAAMDRTILDFLSEVTDEEEVLMQLATGIKLGCSVVPERCRKNPKTQEDIVCAPTVKPKTVFSREFRALVQQRYEEKKAE